MYTTLLCIIFCVVSLLTTTEAEVFLTSNALSRGNAKGLGKFRKHIGTYLNVSGRLTHLVERQGACVLACLRNESCFSLNLAKTPDGRSKFLCEVLSTDIYNSSSKIHNNTSWTHFSIDNPCFHHPCRNNGRCQARYHDDNYTCTCPAAYKGRNCKEYVPMSCKDILDRGESKGSGGYYIDPERKGEGPFPVYCDMTNEGGGWMMTLNLTYEASRAAFTPEESIRSLSKFRDGYMGITSKAMGLLQSLTSFTQMRFVCHKQAVGRTLHIVTTPDSKGKAVVDYFSAKTDILPSACRSFTEGTGNNALLTGRCHRWGRDSSGAAFVGLWGHASLPNQVWRMYDHTMYEATMYHWVFKNGRHDCDDTGSAKTDGDFWKIFIR
ncbi:uncharacterized protein LOC5506103 [Nematostella vectensis]|uniref:uncharacterized protein LOC5506103 n=1 Tax=Nematostella vectensis TaxID=45351 RepID=UPI002076E820|nr:uncharacterized protein LOC5506103 [Nematostella vectensis]